MVGISEMVEKQTAISSGCFRALKSSDHFPRMNRCNVKTRDILATTSLLKDISGSFQEFKHGLDRKKKNQMGEP